MIGILVSGTRHLRIANFVTPAPGQSEDSVMSGTTKPIGKLNFDIAPEALKEIISSGRLSEFVAAAAAQAAEHISAQIVDNVAAAAVSPGNISGAKVNVDFVFEGGDFGS